MKISGHFQQKNGDDPTMEWILARTGIVTASEADYLISPLGKIRTGEGVETYLCNKLAEKWQGAPLDAFESFAMGQGVILEKEALNFAAFEYGLKIQQVGFVSTDSGRAGCSPDGLVNFDESKISRTAPTPYKLSGGEAGFELKCPNLNTQIKRILKGELPPEYVAQLQMSMHITGCKTWHFLSYRRNMPALHLIVEQDLKYQAALEQALDEFRARFDIAMAKLVEINGGEPNPKQRGAVPFRVAEVAKEMVDFRV